MKNKKKQRIQIDDVDLDVDDAKLWRKFGQKNCKRTKNVKKKEKRKEKQGKKTVKRCYANDTEGLPYYGKEKHEIKY